jgi:hypothetical protein
VPANYKKRRGTGAALSMGEFNIRSKSAYNTNNYGFVDGTNGDFYLYLSGVLFLALYLVILYQRLNTVLMVIL